MAQKPSSITGEIWLLYCCRCCPSLPAAYSINSSVAYCKQYLLTVCVLTVYALCRSASVKLIFQLKKEMRRWKLMCLEYFTLEKYSLVSTVVRCKQPFYANNLM